MGIHSCGVRLARNYSRLIVSLKGNAVKRPTIRSTIQFVQAFLVCTKQLKPKCVCVVIVEDLYIHEHIQPLYDLELNGITPKAEASIYVIS